MGYDYKDISILQGKTLINVENIENKEMVFTTTEGDVYKMYHEQDCCEDVMIEDITGDLGDLVGTPVLMAEAVINEGVSEDSDKEYLWTFYKLATLKGYVTIRWLGESNGHYAIGVMFKQINKDT